MKVQTGQEFARRSSNHQGKSPPIPDGFAASQREEQDGPTTDFIAGTPTLAGIAPILLPPSHAAADRRDASLGSPCF